MKILALDLSTKSSGYAIGSDQKLSSYGCITATDKNPYKRIIKMRDLIIQLIKKNKITKIVIEEVRPEYNSHTNKILMYLQASIVLAAYEFNSQIQFNFLGASEWRARIKIKQGRGIKRESLKLQDIEYVKNKYNISANDDQADAICLFDAYFCNIKNEINWN